MQVHVSLVPAWWAVHIAHTTAMPVLSAKVPTFETIAISAPFAQLNLTVFLVTQKTTNVWSALMAIILFSTVAAPAHQ